jgi:hypothetical protein
VSVDKRRGDPEEEKVRDYIKQRRNAWGENDKSSRKSIRRRKASVNRSYRHAARQAVDAWHEPDDVTDAVLKVRRKEWKKFPDLPLALWVELQLHLGARRSGPKGIGPRRSDGRRGTNHQEPRRTRAEALKRLKKTDPQADPYSLW